MNGLWRWQNGGDGRRQDGSMIKLSFRVETEWGWYRTKEIVKREERPFPKNWRIKWTFPHFQKLWRKKEEWNSSGSFSLIIISLCLGKKYLHYLVNLLSIFFRYSHLCGRRAAPFVQRNVIVWHFIPGCPNTRVSGHTVHSQHPDGSGCRRVSMFYVITSCCGSHEV